MIYTLILIHTQINEFSVSDKGYFHQRLLISMDHWGGNGSPIFFGFGGENHVYAYARELGFLWENARHFHAMVVIAEHRYYGQSHPFGNRSFCLNNLGLFNSEQALADFAVNIQKIKKQYHASRSPVIIFGGSYAGDLATWFRMKYPHLVAGSLAASAPLLSLRGNGHNCADFAKRSTESYMKYGKCAQLIKKSWSVIKKKGQTRKGRHWLSNVFHICPRHKLKHKRSVKVLIGYITHIFLTASILNYNNAMSTRKRYLPALPVQKMCRFLTPEQNLDDDSLIRNIFRAISVYTNFSGKAPCKSFRRKKGKGTSGWGFQVCSELIGHSCPNGVTDMYLPPHKNKTAKHKRHCLKKFGFHPDPSRLQRLFGGRRGLLTVTNIIFSNGMRDPFSGGGVTRKNLKGLKLQPSVYILEIPSAAHHEDLSFSGPNDPEPLKKARSTEREIIQSWIQEYRMTQKILERGK